MGEKEPYISVPEDDLGGRVSLRSAAFLVVTRDV